MRAHRKMAAISGPGLVFWGFSVTFMAVDWVLSLDPHWFSTMFGLLFIAGQSLSSMAFLVTLMVLLPGPLVIVMEVGLKVALAPVGSPLTPKPTLPVKPPDGVTVAV